MQFSDELIALVEEAMSHGLDSISEGGPLVPFVMHELAGQRELKRFLVQGEAEDEFDLGQSVEHAREFAAGLSGTAQRVAVVLEGRVGAEGGEKMDAIIVLAFENGQEHAHHFGQGFRSADTPEGFDLVGEGMYLGEAPRLW